MFRTRFALKQKLKKQIAATAAAERARRRPLGIPARRFTEAELAALQPFAEMYSLEENLEEWLQDEVDSEWIWSQQAGGIYRY